VSLTADADIAAFLAESDTRDAMHRAALEREREAYRRGYEDGTEEGRHQAEAEQDAAWHALAAKVISGEAHAVLEHRRWGPGGRKGWLLIKGGAE
jgi:hypothetical protein